MLVMMLFTMSMVGTTWRSIACFNMIQILRLSMSQHPDTLLTTLRQLKVSKDRIVTRTLSTKIAMKLMHLIATLPASQRTNFTNSTTSSSCRPSAASPQYD
jgi:hypothetical protein